MGRVVFRCVVFALGVLLPACLHAQVRDSLRTIESDSVIVVGIREPNISIVDPRAAVVEPVATLVRRSASDIAASALRAVTSSVDVRRYAPLGSAFLSFRGLPAEYTSVYRDGIHVPSEQNSLVDIGQLSLHGIDRVELVPSAESIVLGGDAIGAAVNLVSRRLDTATIRVASDLTHYGESELVSEAASSLDLSYAPGERLFLLGGINNANSTGRYPFEGRGVDRPVVRAFDDAHLVSEYASALWLVSDRDQVRLNLNHFSIDRGLPGAAIIPGFGASLVDTREVDDQTFTAASFAHRDSTASFSLSATYQQQFESYSHPATNTFDSAHTDIAGGVAQWSKHFEVLDLFAGAEYTHSRLAGTTNALPNGDSIVSRERAGGYVALSRELLSVLLSGALRVEHVSGTTPVAVLPQIAASVPISRSITAHLAFGRSFHPPTLNELYWSSEGGIPNPDLKPERGGSWSAMLQSPITVGPIDANLGVTYFHTVVQDEILWLSSGASTSSPYNLGPIVTQGAEIRAHARTTLAGLDLALFESYMLLDARLHDKDHFGKEVPYSTPASSLFSLSLSRASLGVATITAIYRGHRYTDPGNSTNGMQDYTDPRLPPVTTIDLTYESPTIALSTTRLSLRVALLNVGNVQQAEFPGYPLPARTFKLSTSLIY